MLSDDPLDVLFGSRSAARVLLYLQAYGEAYKTEVARTFDMSPSMVQNQFDKFEDVGLLVSRPQGRMRIYGFNPRNALAKDLQQLLAKALARMPLEAQDRYFTDRRRPRRRDKAS